MKQWAIVAGRHAVGPACWRQNVVRPWLVGVPGASHFDAQSRSIATGKPRLAAHIERVHTNVPGQLAGISTILGHGLPSLPVYGLHREIRSELSLDHAFDDHSQLSVTTADADMSWWKNVQTLIRRGQIMQAMSEIISKIDPNQTKTLITSQARMGPGVYDIINKSIQNMAVVARWKPSQWSRAPQQEVQAEIVWMPAQIQSQERARSLPAPVLSVHAIVSLYDLANMNGAMPGDTAIASAVRAFAYQFDIKTFAQCLRFMLLQMGGTSFQEAQIQVMDSTVTPHPIDWQSVTRNVLCAIIDAYGILQRPEVGESYLLSWSEARARSQGRSAAVDAFVQLPEGTNQPNARHLSAGEWTNAEEIWCSLIQARGRADDVIGARHWLQEYRRINNNAQRNQSPYLQYLRVCTQMQESQHPASRFQNRISKRCRKLDHVREAISMTNDDRIDVNPELFGLVVNIEVGFGQLQQAATLIHLALANQQVHLMTPSIYKAIFKLYKQHAVRSNGYEEPFEKIAAEPLEGESAELAGPKLNFRALCRLLMARHPRKPESWNNEALTSAYSAALETSIVLGDLPLALLIVEVMRSEGLLIRRKTVNAAFSWLIRCNDGHGGLRGPNTSSTDFVQVWDNHTPSDLGYKLLKLLQFMEGPSRRIGQQESMIAIPEDVTEAGTRVGSMECGGPSQLGVALRSMLLWTLQASSGYDKSQLASCAPWLQLARRSARRRAHTDARRRMRAIPTADFEDPSIILAACLEPIISDSAGRRLPSLRHILPRLGRRNFIPPQMRRRFQQRQPISATKDAS